MTPSTSRSPSASAAHDVGAELFLDRARHPTAGAQLSERGRTGHGAPRMAAACGRTAASVRRDFPRPSRRPVDGPRLAAHVNALTIRRAFRGQRRVRFTSSRECRETILEHDGDNDDPARRRRSDRARAQAGGRTDPQAVDLGPAARSRFYRSAVGKKWVMAVTGVILIGLRRHPPDRQPEALPLEGGDQPLRRGAARHARPPAAAHRAAVDDPHRADPRVRVPHPLRVRAHA